MMAALACGAGFGAGLWLVARGLWPVRPSLAEALASLHRPVTRSTITWIGASPGDPAGFAIRLGAPLARLLQGTDPSAWVPSRVRRDLVVLGIPAERHLAEKCALALMGSLVVPAMVALAALGGVTVAWELPAWGCLLLGVGGFFAPDLGVHSEAETARGDFRHALGSFLDLVTISLSGGAGVETALSDAAAVGSGPALERLSGAFEQSRLAREAPWGALARLGEELGVTELCELAAAVSLAGSEGAKVRSSLAAKATALRRRSLARAEGQAQAATERMSLPVVLLFAGFMAFIGFPAIEAVLNGL